jgi:hypothetical protein
VASTAGPPDRSGDQDHRASQKVFAAGEWHENLSESTPSASRPTVQIAALLEQAPRATLPSDQHAPGPQKSFVAADANGTSHARSHWISRLRQAAPPEGLRPTGHGRTRPPVRCICASSVRSSSSVSPRSSAAASVKSCGFVAPTMGAETMGARQATTAQHDQWASGTERPLTYDQFASPSPTPSAKTKQATV